MIVGRRHAERHGRLLGSDPGERFDAEGRSPCVVAFHGFTGTTSEIRPVLDRLAGDGFAVRAPLLPGHGSSPVKLQEATFDRWVEEMRGELEAARQRHGDVVLLGFSLGSLVALELALDEPRRGGRPEAAPAEGRVTNQGDEPRRGGSGLAGIVLLGNALTLTAPIRAALGFVDRRGWQLPDWYLLKLWSADMRDPEQKKRIASYDRDPLRAALEVYRPGRRVEPRLHQVTCPALVVHGGKDRVCPPSNLRRVADALGSTSVTTKLYPNSAHLVGADVDRDAVADDVARFVAQRVPVEP